MLPMLTAYQGMWQAHKFDEPQVPYAFDLLAQRLVLWRDGEGQWRCFEDRHAPLKALDILHLLA